MSHVFVDVVGERPRASLEQLDDEPEDQLGGVVLGGHQEERFLKLLDVELQEIEGLPEVEYSSETHTNTTIALCKVCNVTL